jgi:hypothetical protein
MISTLVLGILKKEFVMADIKGQLQRIMTDYASFTQKPSPGECWKLSLTLQDFENVLREHIQEITMSQVSGVIGKLRARTPLTVEDKDFLRLWLVGDADRYIALENNFQEWSVELTRLMGEFQRTDIATTDFTTMANLKAQSLDAIRVLGDILFFLGQKERIDNFVESTKEIDPEETQILIQILEGKIRSKES